MRAIVEKFIGQDEFAQTICAKVQLIIKWAVVSSSAPQNKHFVSSILNLELRTIRVGSMLICSTPFFIYENDIHYRRVYLQIKLKLNK